MPLPEGLTTDQQIEAFVVDARNMWIEAGAELPGNDAEQAVLAASRVVIANILVGDA
jgi:hypothetical protein